MNVTQVTIGRFHHFHLARQLEKAGLLDKIYTGYPSFKLKDENGIPVNKIVTFPWLQMPYMMSRRFGIDRFKWLHKEWAWQSSQTLDKFVASSLKEPTILVGLSGSGLYSGRAAQKLGGYHICDRGSTHIKFQDQILTEEYQRWGLQYQGVDGRVIAKEEQEYHQADKITVPSEYVKQTFITMGVPESKLAKVVYGARIDRFKKVADPPKDVFRVLWVGGIGIRKGFFDLLEAFRMLKYEKKELVVVGGMSAEIQALLHTQPTEGVVFKGLVPNDKLPEIYSTAHVFVLPSIEEGLAMVQGEALACGCPVIATPNAGAEDLFTHGKEGFIVPVRSPKAIHDRLQQLIDEPELREKMSVDAQKKVGSIGGWDAYGEAYTALVNSIITG